MAIENPLDNREQLLDLFVVCANVAEPEHPYKSNPYPMTREELKAGWCRSDGPYWAKCGPCRKGHTIQFDPCTKKLISMRFEKVLAIITHELAHVTEGRHTDGGNHNKSFWREMAFLAWMIRESLGEIESAVGIEVPESEYVSAVVHDPNQFTVDNRVETVTERRQEMADLLGVDPSVVSSSRNSEAKLEQAI